MNGRWQPGQSGNPNGRPPGSGAVAELRAGIAARVPEILSKLIDAAIAGDTQAARLLLERVLPPVKAVELPVEMTLSVKAVRPTKPVRCSLRRPEESSPLTRPCP